jgi:hypothetical protein
LPKGGEIFPPCLSGPLPTGRQAVPTEGGAGRGVIRDFWIFSEISKKTLDNLFGVCYRIRKF